MEKIRFTTLFPRIEDIHLVKDVGMIPYCMHKYYEFDSSIVVYPNKEYKYFDKDVKDLKKDFFPLKKFNSIINCILYLLKKSKKIDVLHLYHIGEKTTMASIFTYLFLNKKGLIYIHMDQNTNDDMQDIFCINGNSLKQIVKRFVLKKIIYTQNNRKRILFGLQNKVGIELLKHQFPFDNIEYISNSYEDTVKSDFKFKKENIILFVGRVGSKEKRTDILLEGFKKAFENINDWKLRIVGPINKDFEGYIKDFKKNNVELMKNIEFIGPIYDRKKLKKEYSKAKVFCLTSDYESFGLVTVEALANGCAIVSSDINASREITNNGEFGKFFQCGDVNDFSKVLSETCNDNKLLKYVEKKHKNYIQRNYSYEATLKTLYNWIIENKNR